MDAAYDHIQEEVLRPDEAASQQTNQQPEGSLNTELQEAYKSFSASPWGARLGGFLGSVKKQGESYYQGARQEAAAASEEALKGFSDLKSTLVSRARTLSTGEGSLLPSIASTTGEKAPGEGESEGAKKERTESDALRESESLVSRFRSEAAKRLKDIEKAEDAADEALLKFGTNIRNFLRDAVSIAPPTEEKDMDGNNKVLFESQDSDGKRVIHTTRFEAQLHVIHSSLDSFTKDPVSPEYEKWKTSDFSVEKKTSDIAADLEKYEELRRAMERLVPEKVEYEQFWKRYYFLRMVVQSEEQRRKELLKGATLSSVEEIGWDEDSDSEPSTPQPRSSSSLAHPSRPTSASTPTASTTISASPTTDHSSNVEVESLKPNEPRKSQDQNSQPDSDASYDLVSGSTSRAPPSPKEEKQEKKKTKKGGEESDEEDWE